MITKSKKSEKTETNRSNKKSKKFNSFAEQYRPQKWDEFIGNETMVSIMKNYIVNDTPVRGIWISGPSGVGKTTLANLFIKSIRCVNHRKGIYEPCGECEVCKGLDTTNYHEHTVSDATQVKEILNEFIRLSKQRPLPTSSGGPRRVVIQLNEAQNASEAARSMLYEAIETSPESTTWIIITMDGTKINPSQKEALEYRCLSFPLSSPSEEQIANNIIEKVDEIKDYKVALAIAKYSEGNVRKSLSLLESLASYKTLSSITEHDVHHLYAGGCDPKSRAYFWKYLKEINYNKTKEIFRMWRRSISDQRIFELLVDDLIEYPSPEQRALLSALGTWKKSSLDNRLEMALYPFAGSKALPEIKIDEVKEIKEVKEIDETSELTAYKSEESNNNINNSNNSIINEDMQLEPVQELISKVTGKYLSKMTILKNDRNIPENISPLLHLNRWQDIENFYGNLYN